MAAVRALRECPHLRIEIWGTRFCGFNLDVGHPQIRVGDYRVVYAIDDEKMLVR